MIWMSDGLESRNKKLQNTLESRTSSYLTNLLVNRVYFFRKKRYCNLIFLVAYTVNTQHKKISIDKYLIDKHLFFPMLCEAFAKK